jgi:hypothetical protein
MLKSNHRFILEYFRELIGSISVEELTNNQELIKATKMTIEKLKASELRGGLK